VRRRAEFVHLHNSYARHHRLSRLRVSISSTPAWTNHCGAMCSRIDDNLVVFIRGNRLPIWFVGLLYNLNLDRKTYLSQTTYWPKIEKL